MRSAVGTPIVVGGRVWARSSFSRRDPRRFRTTRRHGWQTSRNSSRRRSRTPSRAPRSARLADEQAALRRVATLVAREASPVELLRAVADEVARVVDVEAVGMLRFEPDETATLVAQSAHRGTRLRWARASRWRGERRHSGVPNREGRSPRRLGERHGPGRRNGECPGHSFERRHSDRRRKAGVGHADRRHESGRAASGRDRLADRGVHRVGRDGNRQCGSASTSWRGWSTSRPRYGESRTLVAEGAAPTEVFDAVITEVGQLLEQPRPAWPATENEHEISVLAIRGQSPEILHTGARLPLDGDSVNARILRTGRSARLNFAEAGSGRIAEVLRHDDVNATVGAPIVVDGALRGMIGASWRGNRATARERGEAGREVHRAGGHGDREYREPRRVGRLRGTCSRSRRRASGSAPSRDTRRQGRKLRRTVRRRHQGGRGRLEVPVVALHRYEPRPDVHDGRHRRRDDVPGRQSLAGRGRGRGRDDPRHRAPGVEAGVHDDAGTSGRRLESRRDGLGRWRPGRGRRLHLGVHDRRRPPGRPIPDGT